MSVKPFYLKDEQEHERRLSKRVMLDVPCFLMVRIDESAPIKVMLTDISASGAQIALPPANATVGVPGESRVQFVGFPPELAVLGSIPGVVVWIGDEHWGVLFDTPIGMSLEELSDLAGAC